ncbi:hypothetical protein D3C80_2131290 [compost metagenome]
MEIRWLSIRQGACDVSGAASTHYKESQAFDFSLRAPTLVKYAASQQSVFCLHARLYLMLHLIPH